MTTTTRHKPSRPEILVFVAALVIAASAVGLMSPIMDDYYLSFRRVARDLLAGQTNLYDKPGVEFYNAPWLVGIVIPTAAYPLEIAQVLFTALMLLSLVWSIIALGETPRPLVVAAAVINQPFLNMLINGEVDALPLLGISIGYLAIKRKNDSLLSASFFLMAIKPNNLALVFVLYLFASRKWQAFVVPIAASLVYGLLIGWDWPLRLLAQLSTTPPPVAPLTTIWRSGLPPALLVALAVFAVFVWAYMIKRDGLTLGTLALTLATGLAFAPYALSAHYVMLVPAFLFLAKRNPLLAIPAYLTTWILLLARPEEVWLASLYPITLLVLILVITAKDLRGGESALAALPHPDA